MFKIVTVFEILKRKCKRPVLLGIPQEGRKPLNGAIGLL